MSIPNKIVSDPYKIRQILINLIDKAIKYSNEGTINITASLK